MRSKDGVKAIRQTGRSALVSGQTGREAGLADATCGGGTCMTWLHEIAGE